MCKKRKQPTHITDIMQITPCTFFNPGGRSTKFFDFYSPASSNQQQRFEGKTLIENNLKDNLLRCHLAGRGNNQTGFIFSAWGKAAGSVLRRDGGHIHKFQRLLLQWPWRPDRVHTILPVTRVWQARCLTYGLRPATKSGLPLSAELRRVVRRSRGAIQKTATGGPPVHRFSAPPRLKYRRQYRGERG